MPDRPALLPSLKRAVLADGPGRTDGQLLGDYVRDGCDAAFAALVKRHGRMVLGVCRRVVGDPHAADDAFQAVFLVLARKAQSVRPREQLAGWLYAVAFRTALKAKATRARRRLAETQVDPMPHPIVLPAEDVWADLAPVIDAELARLPDAQRVAVVLCDVEGRPQREVAKQLGVPPGTLAGRLATARRTLAKRLTDRGITLPAGALASVLTAHAATAAVPPGLATAVADTAAAVASGTVPAGAVPASVLQLTDGVLRMMALAKLKATAGLLVLALALTGGLGVGLLPARAADPAPAKPVVRPDLSDAEFLKRVCREIRGTAATSVELGYFAEDKNTDKRAAVTKLLLDTAGQPVATAGQPRALIAQHIDVEAPNGTLSLSADGTVRHWLVARQVVDPTADAARLGLLLDDLTYDKTNDQRLLAWRWTRPHPHAEGAERLALDASVNLSLSVAESDEQYLVRVVQAARGGPPTAVEKHYFLADKSGAKRDKLLDLLLADPAVAKTVGPNWKQEVKAPSQQLFVYFTPSVAPAARFDKLLDQLVTADRADEQVMNGLTLALAGRLPTDAEKKLALSQVAGAKDRKQAWAGVVNALAGTADATNHAAALRAATGK